MKSSRFFVYDQAVMVASVNRLKQALRYQINTNINKSRFVLSQKETFHITRRLHKTTTI